MIGWLVDWLDRWLRGWLADGRAYSPILTGVLRFVWILFLFWYKHARTHRHTDTDTHSPLPPTEHYSEHDGTRASVLTLFVDWLDGYSRVSSQVVSHRYREKKEVEIR